MNLPAVHILNSLKRFLTSRTTVVSVIALLTAAMAIAAIVPQRPGMPGKLSWGLSHVFSAWWFVVLAILFLISLVLSTTDQFRLALIRTRRPPLPASSGDEVPALRKEEVALVLSEAGYRRLHDAGGIALYMKGRHGYWGSFLLHLGMTVTVLFSLGYVLTEHRVIVRLVAGEPAVLAEATTAERRGLLAREVPLPATMTLVTMRPTFWENDQLRELESDLVLTAEGGRPQPLRVGINDKQNWRGLILYHRNAFGTAFLIEYERQGQVGKKVLQLPMPKKRDEPGYGDATLDGGYRIRAKYYADAAKKGLLSDDQLLILRLYEGERLVGELPLRKGGSGRIGDFTLRLAGTSWWTELLFEGSRGTAGIFTGFFLLLCGGVVSYFIVPREVVLREKPEGTTIGWRAKRFPEFYREEGSEILTRCRRHDDLP